MLRRRSSVSARPASFSSLDLENSSLKGSPQSSESVEKRTIGELKVMTKKCHELKITAARATEIFPNM